MKIGLCKFISFLWNVVFFIKPVRPNSVHQNYLKGTKKVETKTNKKQKSKTKKKKLSGLKAWNGNAERVSLCFQLFVFPSCHDASRHHGYYLAVGFKR